MAGQRATRGRLARTSALALAVAVWGALAAAAAAVAPAAAQAGWGRPFALTPPGSLDLIPTQLAFSPRGAAAAGFGTEDVDTPGSAQAYVTIRAAGGALSSPFTVAGARQILALAYDASGLELLTGSSPGGMTCCSAAAFVRLSGQGSLERPRTLVSGLTGATQGRLLKLGNGALLAAVATERGVWVVQSSSADRFGAQHRLTAAREMPETMDAAWLGGQSTIVAWTAGTGLSGTADPRTISYATGSRSGPPRRVRTLLTVPPGHRIDELGVARRGSGATAAWVQSWYDRRGSFHSELDTADIAARPAVRRLSSLGQAASGLTIAADAAGDQGVAWKSCRPGGGCTAQATGRGPARAGFGAAHSFGPVDSSQTPALAVGPHGQVVVGWVRSGHPVAAVGSAPGPRFGPVRVLSNTVYALDETVGVGAVGGPLAAWSQGTLNPSVVGAAYTG